MTRVKLKVIVLVLWPIFFLACASYEIRTENVENVPAKKFSGAEVLAVQTKSGDYFRFRNEKPGQIVQDHLSGYAIYPKEFALDEIKEEVRNGQYEVVSFKDAKGATYRPVMAMEKDNKLIAYFADAPLRSVSLPFSDISTVRIKTAKGGGAAAAVITVLVIGGLAIALAAGLSKPSKPAPPPPKLPPVDSCPLVYSYDSENFVLDAEPYGGAICQGLKRTEWLPLDHLRDVDGKYRLLVTNELAESEHTDELKLVVVDHPDGALIVPDIRGGLHTILRPQAALKATDSAGRDIRPYIAASDGYFWTGHPEDMNPDKAETLRDSLTLEFPKPDGARTVKLLADAWTTHQGSASAKGILELQGRDIDKYYRDVNSFGPAYRQLMAWYANEELYMLKVWVETKDGWKPRGLIYGGGPFVAKDKAYVLDVSDVPGDVLRIKLNPPLDFWMLDRLAVDYSADLNLKPVELAATTAVDRNGKDVRGLLAAQDNSYYDMPLAGDRADLTFAAPPQVPGLKRTILLKANGYYDIHLQASGEPQKELFDRVCNEPGFALRFTYQWRQRTLYAQSKPQVH